MASSHALADKIPDEGLRQFASGDSETERPVLIELDLPEPRVRLQERPHQGVVRLRPAEVLTESEEEREEAERRTTQTAHFLHALLSSPPRWLPAAHAYIARVTSAQLRQIARLPFIRAIHPNRPAN